MLNTNQTKKIMIVILILCTFLLFSFFSLTNNFSPVNFRTIESTSNLEKKESYGFKINTQENLKNSTLLPLLTNLESKTKFVVYECRKDCGGFGDRLKGIMSAYALSLLTQRQFIINIEQPCNFTQLFVPNQVNWLFSQHFINKSSTMTRIRCMDRIELGKCFKKFFNIKESSLELSTDILIINTNYQWISYFAKNKNLHENIRKIGYNPQNFHFSLLFHEWFNRLFKLSPTMNTKYEIIKNDAKLNKNLTKIFCAQIRIGGQRPGVANDAKFNTLNITKLFWEFIKENFTSSSQEDWRLFITSDVETVELEALKVFGSERVIRIKGLNSHIDREKNLGNDCSRIEKPIFDFYFLQNCDKAVISNSGFGRLGLWNRKEPYRDLFTLGSCNGCLDTNIGQENNLIKMYNSFANMFN